MARPAKSCFRPCQGDRGSLDALEMHRVPRSRRDQRKIVGGSDGSRAGGHLLSMQFCFEDRAQLRWGDHHDRRSV